jgi:hypothetical protein
MSTERKPGDPSTAAEIKDLDDHINDLVEEAQKHGHSKQEIADALERAASVLDGRTNDDDEDDAA